MFVPIRVHRRPPLCTLLPWGVFLAAVLLLSPTHILGQQSDEIPEVASPSDLLDQFSTQWQQRPWVPEGGRRPGYLRPTDDAGWKYRMRTLHALARQGSESEDLIRQALSDSQPAVRALAAQAAGYCQVPELRDLLADRAKGDPDPTVRLYSVDSLGMLGAGEFQPLLEELAERESNRDVQRHIRYALQRGKKTIQPDVIRGLKAWDPSHMDAAEVGETAPDFELASLGGGPVRLSDYRGQSAVVLVFVYGDT